MHRLQYNQTQICCNGVWLRATQGVHVDTQWCRKLAELNTCSILACLFTMFTIATHMLLGPSGHSRQAEQPCAVRLVNDALHHAEAGSPTSTAVAAAAAWYCSCCLSRQAWSTFYIFERAGKMWLLRYATCSYREASLTKSSGMLNASHAKRTQYDRATSGQPSLTDVH